MKKKEQIKANMYFLKEFLKNDNFDLELSSGLKASAIKIEISRIEAKQTYRQADRKTETQTARLWPH